MAGCFKGTEDKKPVPKLGPKNETELPVPHSKARSCLDEICGSFQDKTATDYWDGLSNLEKNKVKSIFTSEIEPQLEKIFNLAIENKKLDIENIEENLLSGNKKIESIESSLSDEWKVLVNGVRTFQFLAAFYDSAENNDDGFLEIDREKFLKYDWEGGGVNLNNYDLDWLFKFGNEVINLQSFYVFVKFFDEPLEYYLRYKYPSLSIGQAYRKDAEMTVRLIKEFHTIYGPNLLPPEAIRLSKKIISGMTPNKAEQKSYFYYSFVTKMFLDFLKKPLKKFLLDKPLKIASVANQLKTNKNLSKLKNLIDPNGDEFLSNKNKFILSCKKAFLNRYSASPTQKELDVIKEKIFQLQKVASSTASEYLIAQDGDSVILDRIQGANFIYPTTRLNIQEVVSATIDSKLKREKHIKEKNREHNNDFSYGTSVTDALDIINGENLYDDLLDFCNNEIAPSPSYNDSTYSDIILVSWQSIKDVTNLFVIAHEISHKIFGSIKDDILKNEELPKAPEIFNEKIESTKYGKGLMCVAGWHNDFDTSEKQLFDMHYLSEDWADYFALRILKKSGNEIKRNSLCSLYDFSPTYRDHLHLENPDPKDIHSSWFLRTIRAEIQISDHLPSSCQIVVNDSRYKEVIRNCFATE